MISINTSGVPLKVSVIVPGSGYLFSTSIPTYNVNRFHQNNGQIITVDMFTDSLGPNKLDNLHVDLTLGPSGNVISAIPSPSLSGTSYNEGNTVAVRKNPYGNSSGFLGNICILSIDNVS